VADRKRILVVEDDAQLRGLFRMALTLEGFEVREHGNAYDALRSLDSDPPDLVVLDLMLPGLDGLHVAEEITRSVPTRHIPVVIVTGSGRDLSGVNAACVLRKPVTPDTLVETVRKYLQEGAPLTRL
jgi:DNA-binding response OmpR family regulator